MAKGRSRESATEVTLVMAGGVSGGYYLGGKERGGLGYRLTPPSSGLTITALET